MSEHPAYRDRYPCPTCKTGYLDCAQSALVGMKCCKACEHPGRWDTNPPYTSDEIADMKLRATSRYEPSAETPTIEDAE